MDSSSLSQVSLESFPEAEKASSRSTPPPSETMNNPPTFHLFVDLPIEPTALLPAVLAAEIRDFKRQCKMANGIMLVLLAISATLFATIPGPVDPDRVVLRVIDPSLALTSLVGSFCLVFYSFWSHPGAELAKVQGKAMGFSTVLLVLAALSRLALLFPCQLLLAIVAIVIMLIGLLFLLLYFT